VTAEGLNFPLELNGANKKLHIAEKRYVLLYFHSFTKDDVF